MISLLGSCSTRNFGHHNVVGQFSAISSESVRQLADVYPQFIVLHSDFPSNEYDELLLESDRSFGKESRQVTHLFFF